MASPARHEFGHILDRLPRARFGERDRGFDFGVHGGLDPCEILVGDQMLLLQESLERRNGVARFPSLDLVLAPIELGIGHRMPAKSIGAKLQKLRLHSLAYELRALTRRSLHG